MLLTEERFVCAVRCGHPGVIDGVALALDTYCALPHVLVAPTGHDFRGAVDHVLKAQGRVRRVRLSVPSFFAAAELVRRSDDLATLPERLVRMYAGSLQALTPPLPVSCFTIATIGTNALIGTRRWFGSGRNCVWQSAEHRGGG